MGNVKQRILRGAARAAAGAAGVEAVLQNVQIETAEVFRAEALQFLHDEVEFVGVVVRLKFALQLACQGQHVAIDFQPVRHRQRMRHGVEIGQVGEQEFQGIANAAIAFHHALEDFVRDRQFAGIIGGRHPQAQDVGAVLVHHFLRRDDVAFRLAHLVAAAVDHEAVGQQSPVGRAAVGGATGEQAGLEPAAMLVRAFQIEVGGIREFGAALQHAGVGDAGVEPDVERVAGLVVVRGIVAQQFDGVEREPGLDAGRFDTLGDDLQQFRRARMQCAGFLVGEEGHRHAPVALARDAPVGAVPDHRLQPRATPRRKELRRIDRLHGALAQGIPLARKRERVARRVGRGLCACGGG